MLSQEELKQFIQDTNYRVEDAVVFQKMLAQNNYIFKKKQNIQNTNQLTNHFKLGSGGQSHVFLGENSKTKKEVAIKISKCNTNNFNEMKEELRLIKNIFNHDFIVQVYEHFLMDEQQICIQIIELCQMSLDDEIKEMKKTNQKFSPDKVLFIMISTINALCEIHSNNIIHLDIKPQNFLISLNGNYKISDFGFSKRFNLEDSHILQQQVQGGAINYFSPERFKQIVEILNNNDNIKRKLRNVTDVYSLGLSLLEVLGVPTNQIVFLQGNDSEDRLEAIDKLIEEQYMNIYTFIKYFMLELDPTKRYSALRLREKFMYIFKNQFNKQQEENRIRNQIKSYEVDIQNRNKKYLAYLYYFLSTTLGEHTDDSYIKKSLDLITKDLLLIQKFDHSLFLEHLSFIQSYQNKFDQSLQSMETSHRIKQSLYEQSHIESILSFIKLSECWYNIGSDPNNCLNLCQKTFELTENNFKQPHPDKASSLNNMGGSYLLLGNSTKGLDFLFKTLGMFQNLYKGNHPDIALSLHNIGSVYYSIGQGAIGLEYQQKAVDMYQQLYKGNNPDLASSFNNLGSLYQEQGNYKQSLKYLLKSLQMREQLYKGNHPDIAKSHHNLGTLYHTKGDYELGLDYNLRALNMLKQLYTGSNLDLADSLNNVGSSYEAFGEFDKSLKFKLESLQMYQSLYQGNHCNIAQALSNVGTSLSLQNKLDESLQYQIDALNMFKALYQSKNHPSIARCLLNVGCCHSSLKQFNEAITFLHEALVIAETLYKGNHSLIANIQENLGHIYQKQGNINQANFYLSRSQLMFKQLGM